LVTALFEAAESGDQTMHLAARVFPITHSCKANPKDVGRAAAHFLDPVFLHEGATKVTAFVARLLLLSSPPEAMGMSGIASLVCFFLPFFS